MAHGGEPQAHAREQGSTLSVTGLDGLEPERVDGMRVRGADGHEIMLRLDVGGPHRFLRTFRAMPGGDVALVGIRTGDGWRYGRVSPDRRR